MSESLIIFCREWAVTVALTTYLAPEYSCPVTAVYGVSQLVCLLEEHPHTPVVLGLRPHEHVADLYRLQPLLAGRAVLFLGRCFYWTDYKLPEWLGLEQCGFCSWDSMQDPFSRRMELRRFRQFSADIQENDGPEEKNRQPAPVLSAMTAMKILKRSNRWLYRELSASGLTGCEVRVLSLMTEGRNGNLPSRTRSLHKNNGLNKLGMTKHLTDLYRGVKVRAALQSGLSKQAEDISPETENIIPLRQEAGR
ncbi:hypothetical protein IBO29_004062 [Salmonella enterica]|nr:hypothetical protein [Salmonella enterica subsp. enterica serovar Nottingham]EGF0806155.1 hypothetical protein [Salmonella enterica]ECB1784165.1 hypothetical protein [Salmonella enterica subsp. enterica serovar Nottingham]EDX6894461.1 hypothetical protein [Salmonella enterica subsp. enterica serovar Nottingham]EGF6457321.1 hypothetical protein [Salmonella enterica]